MGIFQFLTNEKWIVIKVAQGPSISTLDMSTHHISSSIITRIGMEEVDKIWIIPLTALVKPCYVVENNNFCYMNSDSDRLINDHIAYIVKPMDEWTNINLISE